MAEQYTTEQIDQLQQQAALNEALRGDDENPESKDEVDLEAVKHHIKKSLLSLRTETLETKDGRVVEMELLPGQKIIKGEDGSIELTDPDRSDMLCNQSCVQMIFHTIEGNVNENITHSYLDGKDVFHMGDAACVDVAEKLVVNKPKYDVGGPPDASQIMSVVRNNLKASIKAAYKGRTLKHKEQTVSVREVRTSSDKEDDGGGGRGLFNVLG